MQLWDYFLVSGWKAVLKMGLFVLKNSKANLMNLSFEEILNEITEQPRTLLCVHGVTVKPVGVEEESREGPSTLYKTLKATFKQSEGIKNLKIKDNTFTVSNMLSYHLDRLQLEFEESHSAAKL